MTVAGLERDGGGRMALATRMARLGTEKAFEVLAQVRALEAQGRDIVHLQIGEPDFDTPVHISIAVLFIPIPLDGRQ